MEGREAPSQLVQIKPSFVKHCGSDTCFFYFFNYYYWAAAVVQQLSCHKSTNPSSELLSSLYVC